MSVKLLSLTIYLTVVSVSLSAIDWLTALLSWSNTSQTSGLKSSFHNHKLGVELLF